MEIEFSQTKYWKEWFYITLPFAFVVLGGVFVILSIIFDRFIAYSLNTFFLAISATAIWRFYQDKLFFLQKVGLEEKEYLTQVELYNTRYHQANFVLLGIWVWMLFASKFF